MARRPAAPGGIGAGRPGPGLQRSRLAPLLALALAILPAATRPAPAAEVAIPHPNVEELEPQVREQLAAERLRLEESLRQPDDAAARAQAYGEMGRFYLTYHLRDAAAACLANARSLAPNAFPWSYLLGVALQEDGRLAEAAGAFGRALELDPGYAAGWVRLGQVELEAGKQLEAQEAFMKALGEPGAAAAAHFGLGRAAAAAGRFGEAIEHFEAALRLQPEAAAARYPLALAYRRAGDVEAARRELEQRGSREITFSDPLVKALDSLRRGVALDLELAGLALREHRYSEAERHFLDALGAEPENAAALAGLAEARVGTGDATGARSTYRRLLEVEAEDPSGHYGLGTLLLGLGEAEEAATHLQRAVELAPAVAAARLNLGTALARLGRLPEAEAAFAMALELEPENRLALQQLALTQAALGRHGEAAEKLARVLAADPGDVRSRLELGLCLLALGRRQAALQELEAVLDSPATPPLLAARAHLALATALLADGRCREARQHLDQAHGHLPQDGDLAHLLARTLASCADPLARDGERALALAVPVFQASPTVEHAETVAMALAELGRFGEAAEWQERALGEARRRELPAGDLTALEERLALYREGRSYRSP